MQNIVTLQFCYNKLNDVLFVINTAWVLAQLCRLKKGCTRLAAASDKVYQLLPMVSGSLRVLLLHPPLTLVAMM